MAKHKSKRKKSLNPNRPTKKIKKTRKLVREDLFVFGCERGTKEIVLIDYHGSTINNLIKLSRLLRNDKTTLWFAISDNFDEVYNWDNWMQSDARSFNRDVEAAVADFQTYFMNKQDSIQKRIDEILKMPKLKIKYDLVDRLARLLEWEMGEWRGSLALKP
jgi:hypothetical protein